MAETLQEKHWYLAVGDRSIGPLTTDLVVRGIESGKVPLTAWICPVGASSWSSLSSLAEFQDLVDRLLASDVPANEQPSASGLAKPEEEVAEEDPTGQHAVLPYERTEPDASSSADVLTSVGTLGVPARDAFPSFTEQSGQREIPPAIQALPIEDQTWSAPGDGQSSTPAFSALADHHKLGTDDTRAAHDDLGIDITFDEDDANAIDWKERFQSYFLVGTDVELPEEERLLKSLLETPRSVFLHDEALWNLSLCLAFGTEAVANTSAKTFFEAVDGDHVLERIEWICRTLLSKGFMPSGIPRSEGMRGVEMLKNVCPSHLAHVLARESMD